MSDITQAIVVWMQGHISNPYLATILLSIVPMIEVRGAITVATGLGINPWVAYALSCCSALIVCPFLLLLLKPILKLLKKVKWFNRFAVAVEDLFKGKAEKLDNSAIEGDSNIDKKKLAFNKALGVFLFVAVPLPMTGVWTGSAVAVFLDLKYKYSVPAIVLGNFVAGLIITVLNIVLGKYAPLIILVLGIFVLITIISLVVTMVIRTKKKKNTVTNK